MSFFTLTDEPFNDVGVGRRAVHPLPPAEVFIRLQYAIAVITNQMRNPRDDNKASLTR